MAATNTDLGFYRSSTGDSEGGTRSGTEMVSGTDNALWPDISDASRAAGGTRYRKYFVLNEHATDAFIEPTIWLGSMALGITDSFGLGFDAADDDNADAGTMTAWAANAVAAVISDGADTRALTIFGLDAAGDPVTDGVTLNGTTEVLSTETFSKVYGVLAASESVTRTVLVKQGSGGTTRGTIATNRLCTFLWLSATSKATGMLLPDLAAGSEYGIWRRQVWAPGISAQLPTQSVLNVEQA